MKKKIMDTAIRLFKEKGFENVNIQDICDELHVTRGSFYHHYKNKNDILENYYNLLIQENTDNIAEILLTDVSAKEQLWKLYEIFIDNTITLGPDVLKHLFIASIQDNGSIFSAFSTYNDDILVSRVAKTLITRAQEQGEIQCSVQPEDLGHIFLNCLNSIAIDWSSHNGNFDEKEEIRRLFHLIFHA